MLVGEGGKEVGKMVAHVSEHERVVIGVTMEKNWK